MNSVRLLPRNIVEGALKDAGCVIITEIDDTSELWKTDFGYFFTVPALGDDKVCPTYILHEIMAEIERLRP